MAKVNIGNRLEMDTEQIRTSGTALTASGAKFATDVQTAVDRIVQAEPAIGTGSAADNFHLNYNLPATSVKTSAASSAETLGKLGESMGTAAGEYERVDQEYHDKLRQAGRA